MEHYIVKRDDSDELLSYIMFAKTQLYKSIIDMYGVEPYIKSTNSYLESFNDYHDNIDNADRSVLYDNTAYIKLQEDTPQGQGVIFNENAGEKSIGDYISFCFSEGIYSPTDATIKETLEYYGDISDVRMPDNSSKWNVYKSIEHLVKNAHTVSQHYCAKYVREAIEAGGLNTSGHPATAWEYHSKGFLLTLGFVCITRLTSKKEQSAWTCEHATPGDIAVMYHGKYGHICMWSGKRWISDFIQNNMWVYGGDGTCFIYRFKGMNAVIDSLANNKTIPTANSGFCPQPYPFANVPPYKGIKTYDVRQVKLEPCLTYAELSSADEEGLYKLSGSNITLDGMEYTKTNSTSNKYNNPCNISHSDFDIGFTEDTHTEDDRIIAHYDTPENGIASAMRLLYIKYHNKSVKGINYDIQGYYKKTENISLSALRIIWITRFCQAIKIGPHKKLDMNDPVTLMSVTQQIAILETGTKMGKQLLMAAYKIAFP